MTRTTRTRLQGCSSSEQQGPIEWEGHHLRTLTALREAKAIGAPKISRRLREWGEETTHSNVRNSWRDPGVGEECGALPHRERDQKQLSTSSCRRRCGKECGRKVATKELLHSTAPWPAMQEGKTIGMELVKPTHAQPTGSDLLRLPPCWAAWCAMYLQCECCVVAPQFI